MAGASTLALQGSRIDHSLSDVCADRATPQRASAQSAFLATSGRELSGCGSRPGSRSRCTPLGVRLLFQLGLLVLCAHCMSMLLMAGSESVRQQQRGWRRD